MSKIAPIAGGFNKGPHRTLPKPPAAKAATAIIPDLKEAQGIMGKIVSKCFDYSNDNESYKKYLKIAKVLDDNAARKLIDSFDKYVANFDVKGLEFLDGDVAAIDDKSNYSARLVKNLLYKEIVSSGAKVWEVLERDIAAFTGYCQEFIKAINGAKSDQETQHETLLNLPAFKDDASKAFLRSLIESSIKSCQDGHFPKGFVDKLIVAEIKAVIEQINILQPEKINSQFSEERAKIKKTAEENLQQELIGGAVIRGLGFSENDVVDSIDNHMKKPEKTSEKTAEEHKNDIDAYNALKKTKPELSYAAALVKGIFYQEIKDRDGAKSVVIKETAKIKKNKKLFIETCQKFIEFVIGKVEKGLEITLADVNLLSSKDNLSMAFLSGLINDIKKRGYNNLPQGFINSVIIAEIKLAMAEIDILRPQPERFYSNAPTRGSKIQDIVQVTMVKSSLERLVAVRESCQKVFKEQLKYLAEVHRQQVDALRTGEISIALAMPSTNEFLLKGGTISDVAPAQGGAASKKMILSRDQDNALRAFARAYAQNGADTKAAGKIYKKVDVLIRTGGGKTHLVEKVIAQLFSFDIEEQKGTNVTLNAVAEVLKAAFLNAKNLPAPINYDEFHFYKNLLVRINEILLPNQQIDNVDKLSPKDAIKEIYKLVRNIREQKNTVVTWGASANPDKLAIAVHRIADKMLSAQAVMEKDKGLQDDINREEDLLASLQRKYKSSPIELTASAPATPPKRPSRSAPATPAKAKPRNDMREALAQYASKKDVIDKFFSAENITFKPADNPGEITRFFTEVYGDQGVKINASIEERTSILASFKAFKELWILGRKYSELLEYYKLKSQNAIALQGYLGEGRAGVGEEIKKIESVVADLSGLNTFAMFASEKDVSDGEEQSFSESASSLMSASKKSEAGRSAASPSTEYDLSGYDSDLSTMEAIFRKASEESVTEAPKAPRKAVAATGQQKEVNPLQILRGEFKEKFKAADQEAKELEVLHRSRKELHEDLVKRRNQDSVLRWFGKKVVGDSKGMDVMTPSAEESASFVNVPEFSALEAGRSAPEKNLAALVNSQSINLQAGQRMQYMLPQFTVGNDISAQDLENIKTKSGALAGGIADLIIVPFFVNGEAHCKIYFAGQLSDAIKSDKASIDNHLGTFQGFDAANARVLAIFDSRNSIGGDYGSLSTGITHQVLHLQNLDGVTLDTAMQANRSRDVDPDLIAGVKCKVAVDLPITQEIALATIVEATRLTDKDHVDAYVESKTEYARSKGLVKKLDAAACQLAEISVPKTDGCQDEVEAQNRDEFFQNASEKKIQRYFAARRFLKDNKTTDRNYKKKVDEFNVEKRKQEARELKEVLSQQQRGFEEIVEKLDALKESQNAEILKLSAAINGLEKTISPFDKECADQQKELEKAREFLKQLTKEMDELQRAAEVLGRDFLTLGADSQGADAQLLLRNRVERVESFSRDLELQNRKLLDVTTKYNSGKISAITTKLSQANQQLIRALAEKERAAQEARQEQELEKQRKEQHAFDEAVARLRKRTEGIKKFNKSLDDSLRGIPKNFIEKAKEELSKLDVIAGEIKLLLQNNPLSKDDASKPGEPHSPKEILERYQEEKKSLASDGEGDKKCSFSIFEEALKKITEKKAFVASVLKKCDDLLSRVNANKDKYNRELLVEITSSDGERGQDSFDGLSNTKSEVVDRLAKYVAIIDLSIKSQTEALNKLKTSLQTEEQKQEALREKVEKANSDIIALNESSVNLSKQVMAMNEILGQFADAEKLFEDTNKALLCRQSEELQKSGDSKETKIFRWLLDSEFLKKLRSLCGELDTIRLCVRAQESGKKLQEIQDRLKKLEGIECNEAGIALLEKEIVAVRTKIGALNNKDISVELARDSFWQFKEGVKVFVEKFKDLEVLGNFLPEVLQIKNGLQDNSLDKKMEEVDLLSKKYSAKKDLLVDARSQLQALILANENSLGDFEVRSQAAAFALAKDAIKRSQGQEESLTAAVRSADDSKEEIGRAQGDSARVVIDFAIALSTKLTKDKYLEEDDVTQLIGERDISAFKSEYKAACDLREKSLQKADLFLQNEYQNLKGANEALSKLAEQEQAIEALMQRKRESDTVAQKKSEEELARKLLEEEAAAAAAAAQNLAKQQQEWKNKEDAAANALRQQEALCLQKIEQQQALRAREEEAQRKRLEDEAGAAQQLQLAEAAAAAADAKAKTLRDAELAAAQAQRDDEARAEARARAIAEAAARLRASEQQAALLLAQQALLLNNEGELAAKTAIATHKQYKNADLAEFIASNVLEFYNNPSPQPLAINGAAFLIWSKISIYPDGPQSKAPGQAQRPIITANIMQFAREDKNWHVKKDNPNSNVLYYGGKSPENLDPARNLMHMRFANLHFAETVGNKIFDDASMYEATFVNCDFTNIDFTKIPDLRTVKFVNCNLTKCRLPEAPIIDINKQFEGCTRDGMKFGGSRIVPAPVIPAASPQSPVAQRVAREVKRDRLLINRGIGVVASENNTIPRR